MSPNKPALIVINSRIVVVTIPRGSLLELMVRDQPVGVCNALWNGRWVFVFCEDVDRNGVIVENRQ
jgi:hypothetical protein